MIRRSLAMPSRLALAAAAVVLIAGCGNSKATGPVHSAAPVLSPSSVATPTPTPTPTPSPSPSDSPGPSATPVPTFLLPHVDAALEDKLPSSIGGAKLVKFSLLLQGYMDSETGGDKELYPTWLVKYGLTPSEVKIAVAVSPLDGVNFNARAIAVPGVKATTLTADFTQVASKAGWITQLHKNWGATGKDIEELTDPSATRAGYVYAKEGILFEIVTDNSALLLEALMAP